MSLNKEALTLAARSMAQHLGPEEFDKLPADRVELRTMARAGIVDYGSPTRDDLLELAEAAVATYLAALPRPTSIADLGAEDGDGPLPVYKGVIR